MCKMDILKHYGMLVEEVDEEDHDANSRQRQRRRRQQQLQRNRRSELSGRSERVEPRPGVEGEDREDAVVSLV